MKLSQIAEIGLCLAMSCDLVNHKKWLWYRIDARNGKSEMKLVRASILRPLTSKCVILERFESLKNVEEHCAEWQSLLSSRCFLYF